MVTTTNPGNETQSLVYAAGIRQQAQSSILLEERTLDADFLKPFAKPLPTLTDCRDRRFECGGDFFVALAFESSQEDKMAIGFRELVQCANQGGHFLVACRTTAGGGDARGQPEGSLVQPLSHTMVPVLSNEFSKNEARDAKDPLTKRPLERVKSLGVCESSEPGFLEDLLRFQIPTQIEGNAALRPGIERRDQHLESEEQIRFRVSVAY